jgi:hypothetical protein
MASMDAGSTNLHPDFGPSGGYPYGIPFTVVTNEHKQVRITFSYASQSNRRPYPFGADTPIEGGKNAGGDRHAIMVNSQTCTLYELWNARYSASRPKAGSGAIWKLTSNALDLGGRRGPADPAGPADLRTGQGGGAHRTADHARDPVHRAADPVGLHLAGPARGGVGLEPRPAPDGRPVPAASQLPGRPVLRQPAQPVLPGRQGHPGGNAALRADPGR